MNTMTNEPAGAVPEIDKALERDQKYFRKIGYVDALERYGFKSSDEVKKTYDNLLKGKKS